jgi:2-polyprenyl-6-methoxyphenol hydroxylase-like FAD-dependent oxidoreductase
MQVLIAGGGIGGLAAAIALHDAGIGARVFEGAREVKPLGVGINLQPHAVRELAELGLLEKLLATGVPTREFVYANRHGQEIWAEPRGLDAGYRWPQISIHRGRLQVLLWAAARARLGAECVHAGRRVLGFEQDEAGVTLRLAEGDSVRGDVLVAADGIHSRIRAGFFPEEGPPRWNGCVLWRAVSHGAPFRTGASMVQAGHRDLKFVTYPVSAVRDGEQEINWIAERRCSPEQAWSREDWNREGRIAEVLPHFAAWRFPWLDIPALIARAAAVWEFPMVDRDPLPRWTHGRATLLGDAAHPMYPIGSNGASQAVLDARWLARCLALHGADAGLAAYEDARRPATAAIVAANRADGPDRVMDLAEQRAPDGFADREAVLSRVEIAAILDGYKRMAGMWPEALNARESWGVTPAPRPAP